MSGAPEGLTHLQDAPPPGLDDAQLHAWAHKRLHTATKPAHVRTALRVLHEMGIELGRPFQAIARQKLRELGETAGEPGGTDPA